MPLKMNIGIFLIYVLTKILFVLIIWYFLRYQMYIDGLPAWGRVGERVDKNFYLYTHKRLEIGYNGKQIIDVNLVADDKKELLTVGAKISFTYEVSWKASNVHFKNRFEKYLDPNFFQHRVIINISYIHIAIK